MDAATAPATKRVLLLTRDHLLTSSVMRALRKSATRVDWAQSLSELDAGADRAGLPAPGSLFLDLELPDLRSDEAVLDLRARFPAASLVALSAAGDGVRTTRLESLGVDSFTKPLGPIVLASLAFRLASRRASPTGTAESAGSRDEWRTHFRHVLGAYARYRALSGQQRVVLNLYLDGKNDKEIAQLCNCSETTVYEHWRRMARKAGGTFKSDVVADFHHYLSGA